MKHCSEALSIYNTFCVMVHTHFDTYLCFRADSEGEYLFEIFAKYLLSRILLPSFLVLVLMLKMELLSA
jgi:hypothetical protein